MDRHDPQGCLQQMANAGLAVAVFGLLTALRERICEPWHFIVGGLIVALGAILAYGMRSMRDR